jgi:hypothetical protein
MELLTMATHALSSSHILDDDEATAAAHASARISPLRRLYIAVLESQMRRAQREVDRVLGPGAMQHAMRTKLPLQR